MSLTPPLSPDLQAPQNPCGPCGPHGTGLWRALANGAQRVPGPALRAKAAELGLSLLQAEQAVCAAGLMPERYARNAQSLSPAHQLSLLQARVLLVGLGGLGGHVLDTLARLGVGNIVGVDGDIFEESNSNRQLLATGDSLGQSKAGAAARHVATVNPAVHFSPLPFFVRGADFVPLAQDVDVVVDALGGLDDRAALHAAAAKAGKPVVCAGIAGYTGWVAVVHPGDTSPVDILGLERSPKAQPGQQSAEEKLGNLAPTAGLAASLQCAEILKLLTRQETMRGMLLFDLQDQTFTSIAL